MTKIKICGLRTLEDIEFVNEARPDYAGCILSRDERFWRRITEDEAKALRSKLRLSIPLVGVFVNDDLSYVCRLLNEGVIDIAQLHGTEDNRYIEEVKKQSGKPVFKAFKVTSIYDLEKAKESIADEVLLDGGTGEGKGFNWALLKGYNRPYFLAGGLSPENLEEAIKNNKPMGVDISSGVETEKHKDKDKILSAVKIAHGER